MTTTIKSTRLLAGVSVTDLAERLGVTPSAVSQLERSEALGTIKVKSLREALAALGADLRIAVGPQHRLSTYAPYRVADSMSRALLDADSTFALRLLTHGTKELADHLAEFSDGELDAPPTPLPHAGWDALLRAEYARAIPASRRPAWARATRLPEPWFVSQYPALRERARAGTPAHLRRLNIFVDERSLTRS